MILGYRYTKAIYWAVHIISLAGQVERGHDFHVLK